MEQEKMYTEGLPAELYLLAENIAGVILARYGMTYTVDNVLKYALVDMARKFGVDLEGMNVWER